jgi:hypothetical protein
VSVCEGYRPTPTFTRPSWYRCPASSRAIAGNYAAAASLILLGYTFYATVPYATQVTRVYYDRLFP